MAVLDRETRGLNRLDPKLTKADTALDRFGKFYAQNYPINPGRGPDGQFVEGWAQQTLLGRVIEFGNQGAAQPGSGPTTIPAIIVLVDKIYAKFEPRRKLVILSVYAYKRNHPQVVQRRWTQLSDDVFRSELRIAREIVCHALELYRPE
jgi:hypothetical protein